jgi:NAD+ synthase (glutamine-hydrolysing)
VRNLVVAFGQTNPVVGDFSLNLEQIKEMIARASDRADVIVFGELALCGYPLGDLSYRKDIIDASEKALDDLLEYTKSFPKLTVVVGHASHARKRTATSQESFAIAHNSASVLLAGKLIGTYHKQLLPNFDVFDDWRNFVPGDQELIFEIKGIKCALAICQDIWTSDDTRRKALAAAGVELLIVPNGSPFEKGKRQLRLEAARTFRMALRLPIPICPVARTSSSLMAAAS